MSFTTPSHPALDRSSVTPPENSGQDKPRSTFRMKPESAALKKLKRERQRKWEASQLAELEKKGDDQADTFVPNTVAADTQAEDFIEIRGSVALESDDAGAGPLDKDDSLYRDRSVRSRIASVQSARDGVIRTRSASSRRDVVPRSSEQTLAPSAPPGLPPPKRKKGFKSAAVVDSESDEPGVLQGCQTSSKRQRRSSPSSTKRRWPFSLSPPPRRPSPLPSPPPPPDMPHAEDLPSVMDIFNGDVTFVDDEAVESGSGEEDDQKDVKDQDVDNVSVNDYDYGDPFIDDSALVSNESDSSMHGPDTHPLPHERTTLGSPFPLVPVDFSPDESEDSGKERALRRLVKGMRRVKKRLVEYLTDSGDDSDNRPLRPPPDVPIENRGRPDASLAPTTEYKSGPKPKPRPVSKKAQVQAPISGRRVSIVEITSGSDHDQEMSSPEHDKRRPVPSSPRGASTPTPAPRPRHKTTATAKRSTSSVIPSTRAGDHVRRSSTVHPSADLKTGRTSTMDKSNTQQKGKTKVDPAVKVPVKTPSAQKVDTNTDSPVVAHTQDKGKGRDRSSPAPASVCESDDDGSVHLSDMSDWERKQWQKAILESKKSLLKTTSAGESSTQGVGGSVSPHGSGSSLATPVARALFTTPSSSAPLHHLPTPQSPSNGGAPMSMAELVRRARANADGSAARASPVVEPPPSNVASSGYSRGVSMVLIRRCTAADIPRICECTHRELQDEFLADQYGFLIPLRDGHIEPWGLGEGPGFVMFSAWGDQCPSMVAQVALDAVNAKESGHIRNPSRTSPIDIGLYAPPNTTNRYNFYCAGDNPMPLVAFSSGMLEDSQITAPSDTGLRQKWVRMILHSQEWHRYKGFVRMVSGHQHLHAQFNKHAMQFSTRPINRSANNPNRNNAEQYNKDKGKGLRAPASKMFNKGSAAGSANRISADTFSLPADAIIPVYDARGVPVFDFEANLPRLAEILPVWSEGEIPYGSFVVVGHTMTVYRSTAGNWTLGCNLQWVIVVGTPEDD